MSAITFEPVEVAAVPRTTRTGTKNGKFLAAVMASGHRAVKVPAGQKVTAGSLNQTAKRQAIPLKAKTVAGVTYVMRTDAVTPAV